MTHPIDHTGAIVVGLGDATENWLELEWAAREAQLRRRPLHVLRAFQVAPSVWPWETITEREINTDLRDAAQRRVDTALAQVAERWPEIVATGAVVAGDARDVLRTAARVAALTVVGSRRLTSLTGVVLGSVSSAVAGTDAGTVVVVGSPAGLDGERPAVVAGIDGTQVGQDVLAFAFEQARARSRTLRVVYCWPKDSLAEMAWRVAPPAPEHAARWLAESLAGWQATFPDVEVERRVLRDHPVDGLVRESASQELLVVGAGSRRSRFAPWLGSVSQGVLHHATCPVAVVHPAPDDADGS